MSKLHLPLPVATHGHYASLLSNTNTTVVRRIGSVEVAPRSIPWCGPQKKNNELGLFLLQDAHKSEKQGRESGKLMVSSYARANNGIRNRELPTHPTPHCRRRQKTGERRGCYRPDLSLHLLPPPHPPCLPQLL
jgi:hypothetical protein